MVKLKKPKTLRQRVFYRYGNLPDFVQSLNSTNDRYPDGLTYKGVHEFENEKKVKMKIVIIFQIKYLEGNPMAYIVTESDGEKKKYLRAGDTNPAANLFRLINALSP